MSKDITVLVNYCDVYIKLESKQHGLKDFIVLVLWSEILVESVEI